MTTPELRANRRPRPIRDAPTQGGGSSSMLVVAVLIAAAVGAAAWAIKERDDRQKLAAENARLTAENEQLQTALSRQQLEATRMRDRLLNPPAQDRQAQRPHSARDPRSTPRPAPRTLPRAAPTPRQAPRSSRQNTAIRSAELVCGAYGYGTVDERACRRREWQKMRDRCASYRSREAFVGPQQRDAHRQVMRMWCDAERQFKIIH